MNSLAYKLFLRLLLALLLFSALPSVVRIPAAIDVVPPNIYLLFVALREIIIISLFLLTCYQFTIFLRRNQSSFNVFLILLSLYLFFICILSFLYSSYGPLVSLTGLRLLVLSIIPLNIMLLPSDKNLPISLSPNILIISFYMMLCGFALIISFNSYPAVYGVTIFGPRFPFLYEGPIPACLAFGSFSCFTLFYQYIFPKKSKILLLCQLIILFFNMLTGGRSGLIVSSLCLAGSLSLILFPKVFKTILCSKRLSNRLFSVILAPVLILSLFLISSNPIISGRYSTADQIEDSGLIGGSFDSRIKIFQRAASNTDNFKLAFGAPGLGTNVSTQFKLIPVTYMNPDSFVSSSFLSFGFLGVILFLTLSFIFWRYSFSLIIFIAFIVFSATTSLPENILPWAQLCLILAYSKSSGVSK